MSEFSVVRRCYGCGAVLQCENPEAPGYIDKETFDRAEISAPLFCEKCWKGTRYNTAPGKAKASSEFLSMLKDAQASDAAIVYVVNLFSFESSFVSEVSELLRGLNILVLANKRDLLPKKADDGKLKEYVAQRFRRASISVTVNDVELISLRSAMDVRPIIDKINKIRKGHDVYVIGAGGAGKTIFVNAFLRGYANPSNREVTISKYPKTSLSVMTIPLDSSSSLYDTPGIAMENSLLCKVDPLTCHQMIPQEEVKGRSSSLTEGETLIFGDNLVRIELLKGEKTPLKVYCSSEIPLYKRRGSKVEEAFYKFIDKIGSKGEASKRGPSDFDAFDISIGESGLRDIGVEGLGWISFLGKRQNFRIYVPKGVALYYNSAKLTFK